MHKIVAVSMLLLSMMAVGARAATPADISIWGGYATFTMDDINKFLQDSVGSGGSVTKVNNGYLIGADALFQVTGAPRLWLGPRVEYLTCNQGKASAAGIDVKEDQYIIPILVGGKYRLIDGNRWGLDGKLFVGLGLGYAKTSLTSTITGISDISQSYSGTGFVSELALGTFYKLSGNLDIDLDLGYRYANLGSMGSGGYGSSSGTGTGTGVTYAPGLRKSTLMNPQNGSSVKYDFSGLILNIGLTYHF